MEINGTIHCLFEQSGSFKRAFNEFGLRGIVLNDHHTTRERSEIAPEYARNFIRDYVLGQPTINSQLAIF